MANSQDIEVRWKVTNPYGHIVVLKQDTYDSHINGDHTSEDAKHRNQVEEQVKEMIEHPRLIVKNKTGESRYEYMDFVQIQNTDNQEIKIKPISAIVETACSPHELVTWIIQSKVKTQIAEGGIVYDAHKGFIG